MGNACECPQCGPSAHCRQRVRSVALFGLGQVRLEPCQNGFGAGLEALFIEVAQRVACLLDEEWVVVGCGRHAYVQLSIEGGTQTGRNDRFERGAMVKAECEELLFEGAFTSIAEAMARASRTSTSAGDVDRRMSSSMSSKSSRVGLGDHAVPHAVAKARSTASAVFIELLRDSWVLRSQVRGQ